MNGICTCITDNLQTFLSLQNQKREEELEFFFSIESFLFLSIGEIHSRERFSIDVNNSHSISKDRSYYVWESFITKQFEIKKRLLEKIFIFVFLFDVSEVLWALK